ncbi:hypothetical protein EVAR_51284_1 [Eumeta japonica]|uniref:RNase H type-1 domain-containing protein n=1 Tax=Eumeta variegata TaxID=151549 RepID=A0A4C1XVD8_EUMVA|nr:hypothetical protein EVAR_51284_1 [Eumeta japonica]
MLYCVYNGECTEEHLALFLPLNSVMISLAENTINRILVCVSDWGAKNKLSADRELEKPVHFCESLHLGGAPDIHFESIKNLDSETIYRFVIKRLHIFTNGYRIERKVGAALTEWRDRVETEHSTFRLKTFCTVFRVKVLTLQRALEKFLRGTDKITDIFSDSRSALQVLTVPKTYNPLAHSAKADVINIAVEGRMVRLFWV